MTPIPRAVTVIDIAPFLRGDAGGRRAVTKSLGDACSDIGFFTLAGHGVPVDLIDRWVSTLHRVVNPPAAQAARSRRQSLVFFHNPNPDAVIACFPTCTSHSQPPRYPPVLAGEYLVEKTNQAYK